MTPRRSSNGSGATGRRRREIELVRRRTRRRPPCVDRRSTAARASRALLRAVAHDLGVGFEFVEGNAELTPARLVGHFDPARVLVDGYDPDVFVDGPLLTSLREGSLLYVEEINRVPEETLNVLVTVMSERELHVPRLGHVTSAPGFRLVAAMNPFDASDCSHLGAIYDRVCRSRSHIRARRRSRRSPSEQCRASMRPGQRSVELCAAQPFPPRTSVGSSSAARSTCAPSPRHSPQCVANRSAHRVSRSTPHWSLCRDACGCARAAVAPPRMWSPSCGRPSSVGASPGTVTMREKMAPRLGPPILVDGAADEGGRRSGRGRRTGPQADHFASRACPQPALRAISPDVGELDEAAVDEALPTTPTTCCDAGRPHWRD